MTDSDLIRPRSVVNASVSPSAYHECSVSADRFSNGNTATDCTRPATDLGAARPRRAPPEDNMSPATVAASTAGHHMARRLGGLSRAGPCRGSGLAVLRP